MADVITTQLKIDTKLAEVSLRLIGEALERTFSEGSKSVVKMGYAFQEMTAKADSNISKLKDALALLISLGKGSTEEANAIRKGLNESTAEANKLADSIKQVEAELSGTAKASTKLTPADSFTKALETAKNNAMQLEQELAHVIATQGNNGKGYDEAVAKLKAATIQAQQLEGALKDAGKTASGGDTGFLSGLKGSFSKAKEEANSGAALFSSVAAKAGELASPLGLAKAGTDLLVQGLEKVFDVGQKFETALTSIGAKTGVSGEALDKIGNQAESMAAKFGGSSIDQLTTFQGIFSKFGTGLAKAPDDLEKVADSVNTFAKATGTDASAALDTLSSTMEQFGVDTKNANDVANISPRFINAMSAAAKVGGADIGQIGEAMKTAGDSMLNANLSFEQGNAAIQLLGTNGKTGAEAGKELKGVLDRISGQDVIPKEGLESLKSLGVDMTKVTDTSLPLEDRLKELGKASGDATTFTKVFGKENAETAKILANGADKISSITDKITGTSDATDAAAKNMGTLAEKFSKGKAGLENFAVDIFKVLEPIVSGIIDSISTAFSVIKDTLGPIFTELGSTLGDVFTRIGVVLKPILAVIGGAVIVNIVETLSIAGVILKVFFDTAVSIFDGIIEALQPLTDVFKSIFNFSDGVTGSFDPLKTFQSILGFITGAVSTLGSILSEVGGFLASVFLTPLKITTAVIAKLIDWVVSLFKNLSTGNSVFAGIGTAIDKVKQVFEGFINIIKSAPEIIHAITAGFKAFTSGITDLISNFSLDKLKDLFSGATFSKAFSDSRNDSNLKAQNEKLIGQFGNSLQRLKEMQNKANNEKDTSQKLADEQAFAKEKERLLTAIEEKKKIGLLNEAQAKELQNKLDAIGLSSFNADKTTPPPPPKAAPTASTAKKQEEDETKGVINAIVQRKKEREDLARATIKNEIKLAITLIEIQADAEKAIVNVKIEAANKILEADKNQKNKRKKLTEEEKEEIRKNIDSLNKESIKINKESQEKITLENGKSDLQDFENHEKNNEAKQKSDIDYAKAAVERNERRVTKTAADEEARLKDLNATKIDLLQKTSASELNEILKNNAAVAKAEADLKEAIASGDKAKRTVAEKVYDEVVKKAIKSDSIILAHSEKTNGELLGLHKQLNQQLKDLTINQTVDTNERERKTKLAALDKQYQEDLVKLGTNEQAKAELTKKYQADKYDTDVEFNRKSSDLWVQSAQVIEDAGLNIAKSFADSMGSTFDDLTQGFDDFANDIKKRIAESKKDNTKSTEEEAGKLLDALKKHEISYADYQAKLADLNKKQAKTNVTTTERANLAIGQAFSILAKQGNDALDSTLKDVGKSSKAFAKTYTEAGNDSKAKNKALADHWKEFGGQISEAGEEMGLSVIGVFGQMAAQGKLTLESAGKAAAAIALDTVSKIVLTQAPAILAIFAGAIPPPFGFIAGLAAIGVVQALLASTKSAIVGDGFYKGGYTGDGNDRESAGVVHKGEVVFESQITRNQKAELLELRSLLQRGMKLSEIIDGYNISKSFERISEHSRDFSNTYIDTSGKLQTIASPVFVPQQNVNQSNIEMIAMRSELTQIRKLLAKAKIIERETKHISAVRLSVEENPQFRIRQEKQALRLERARG